MGVLTPILGCVTRAATHGWESPRGVPAACEGTGSLTKLEKSWSLMSRFTFWNWSKSPLPFSVHRSHMLTAASAFMQADSCTRDMQSAQPRMPPRGTGLPGQAHAPRAAQTPRGQPPGRAEGRSIAKWHCRYAPCRQEGQHVASHHTQTHPDVLQVE